MQADYTILQLRKAGKQRPRRAGWSASVETEGLNDNYHIKSFAISCSSLLGRDRPTSVAEQPWRKVLLQGRLRLIGQKVVRRSLGTGHGRLQQTAVGARPLEDRLPTHTLGLEGGRMG